MILLNLERLRDPSMRNSKFSLEYEDKWLTSMGLVFPGERVVFRGKDLWRDLKDLRWMELLLFGITGRRFDDKQIMLFEKLWTLCTSYPDPRIWNNRVVTLAATARSTGALGVSAGIAVSEATIYGFKPMFQVFDLLLRINKKLKKGSSLEQLIKQEKEKYRIIPGFGRPRADGDERVEPLLQIADDMGLSNGQYLKLALEIKEILLNSKWRLRMNFAPIVAALAADQGLSGREYYNYILLCFTGGMIPCFIDATDKPEGAFLPLRCDRIAFEGKHRRTWKSDGDA